MSHFSKEETDTILKVRCPSKLDSAAAKDFAVQSKAWMLSPTPHFVIDLTAVSMITREFYQAVIQLKTNLKRDSKTIYSVNVSTELLKQIKTDGVDLAFNPINSLDQIFSEERAERPKAPAFDVSLINPFLAAAQKTLEVQCNTKASPLKPTLKIAPLPDIAIAGVLSLSSNAFSGSIVLCFTRAVFLKIYEKMFDEKHQEITSEIEDSVGELLNIIYGLAKIDLNQQGFNFPRALPTVLSGEKMKIRQSGSTPAIVIPFQTEFGLFHIEIEFNEN